MDRDDFEESAMPTSQPNERIGLRDYIERIMDLRFGSAQSALDLQRDEYGRRLKALNHEAAQLKQMQATYAPRELVESKFNEIYKRLELLNIAHEVMQAKASMTQVIVAYIISIIGIGLSLISMFTR